MLLPPVVSQLSPLRYQYVVTRSVGLDGLPGQRLCGGILTTGEQVGSEASGSKSSVDDSEGSGPGQSHCLQNLLEWSPFFPTLSE